LDKRRCIAKIGKEKEVGKNMSQTSSLKCDLCGKEIKDIDYYYYVFGKTLCYWCYIKTTRYLGVCPTMFEILKWEDC
jgi:hypothetical protein